MSSTARPIAQILVDSINSAHRLGITVSTDPRLGVTCTSTVAPLWERDTSGAVSVLGAVLLAEQPPLSLADEALMHVFGSRMVYHIGLEDGVAGQTLSENLTRGVDAGLYRSGYQLGVQVRVLVSTEVCEPHRTRYLRGERCPSCRAGVPVLRLVEEITQEVEA